MMLPLVVFLSIATLIQKNGLGGAAGLQGLTKRAFRGTRTETNKEIYWLRNDAFIPRSGV